MIFLNKNASFAEVEHYVKNQLSCEDYQKDDLWHG